MKLARFRSEQQIFNGIVIAETVVPITVDAGFPATIAELLHQYAKLKPQLEALEQQSNNGIPLNQVELLAPISAPEKFLGVGLNYADHIEETGLQRPDFPTIFNKQSSCIIGPDSPIERPNLSEKLDYEGELAFVIGKYCRHVKAEQAHEVIAGYTIVNDVSIRDWQIKSPTWTLGKSFDTHGPMGPWIVTADSIDPHNLDLKTWVNDELRQHSNTRHLIFDCYNLVETLSSVCTLKPGDVIATGTCSGVGVKMKPRGYMQPGDIVTVEIEGIGRLSNPVIQEDEEHHFIV